MFKPVFEASDKRISGTGEAGGFFNFNIEVRSNSADYVDSAIFAGLDSTQADALREVIYNACETNKAEYLLAPHYNIKTRSFPFLGFIWRKFTRSPSFRFTNSFDTGTPKSRVILSAVASRTKSRRCFSLKHFSKIANNSFGKLIAICFEDFDMPSILNNSRCPHCSLGYNQ